MHGTSRLTLSNLTAGSVLVGGFREKVARHQALDTVNLCHEEAIVVHVSVHMDNLPSLKAQLRLEFENIF